MKIKKLISILITIITVVSVAYLNMPTDLNREKGGEEFLLSQHDTLTLLIEMDSPGIFHYNECYYGFVYDLMREYAFQYNKKLNIEICDNSSVINSRLKDKDVAFALAISPFNNIEKGSFYKTSLVDSCKYEVLGNSNNRKISKLSPSQLINTTKVLFIRGTENIKLFTQKANAFFADTTITRNSDMIDNINLLRQRKYDCVVCKDEEALLYRYLFKSVISVYKPEEFVSSCLIINSNNNSLFEDFERWYGVYSGTNGFRDIYNNYFFNKYLYSFIANGYISPMYSISKYDNIFISESENTIFDWRFLSAISSVESKYTLDLVSHKGATGLMQVMPHIAKHMGVEAKELFDANTNIRCAIKLLNDNVRMLNFKSSSLTDDEQSILLASYNAGYGHVSDAMRLARKHGEDSTSWAVIKKYLHGKREYKYYIQKDVVHSGSFISDETERFVDKVMTKYQEYKGKELR